ncbi:late competence development ComFB family protein [Aestuariirhabdus sp. Z084]|uniref:late competence development ComFB family protein n=1 Tax=Aestuariirhabdus haliotis TaxID=2918751 RepID=UPI00201B3F79|nr:late competence development ComFB family protein [Aestuariirhabdus haliotis]MCL6416081.1 late competence development ComFB family protein [Aestuariirhabdus haliotis]MCL6419351.1 late competence development ComFB family protein [Aestuariirhabdus haliotis]
MALQEEFHNYYEKLVVADLQDRFSDQAELSPLFADIACVALNHLPPRYIHYDIDMAYYLSPEEKKEMDDKVSLAVNQAVDFVASKKREA